MQVLAVGKLFTRFRSPLSSLLLRQESRARISVEIANNFTNKNQPEYGYIEKCPNPEFDTGCTYCTPEYPARSPIKSNAVLFGTAPAIGKHLLICTGTSEWPKRTESDGSSFEALVKQLQSSGLKRDADFNFMLTSTDMPSQTANEKDAWSIYMYPDNLYFPKVQASQVPEFMKRYLIPSMSGFVSEFEKKIEAIPTKQPIIAICAHTARDIRCGIAGPMLKNEFEQVLKAKNLSYDEVTCEGIRVTLTAHVSGHAYAGNVIYFDGEGSSIWYGLVQPKHVQGIVKETIEGRRIIRELHRGGGWI
ncbi:Sucrase/ferredoxin-like-domain-containing protein [Lipomyces oligophaga]|uniref:Sucrase/ferredoxin-like-domain-containing protein n=1 Tax=Lipomyces oligophaga TaxID=45792 RepID=UPI0034CD28A0